MPALSDGRLHASLTRERETAEVFCSGQAFLLVRAANRGRLGGAAALEMPGHRRHLRPAAALLAPAAQSAEAVAKQVPGRGLALGVPRM